jgi:hypothetical protein
LHASSSSGCTGSRISPNPVPGEARAARRQDRRG